MGYITKKPAKDGFPRYYAIYKMPGGRWKWEAGGRLKKNTEALLHRREQEIALGTYGSQKPVSFAVFASRWLSDYAAHRVRPATLRDYTGIVNHHLISCLGHTLLSQITAGQLQQLVTQKLESGLSPARVVKIVVVLKEMFKHAQVWGYLSESPARFVERPRQIRQEMDYLRPHEIRMLLDAASPEHYALFASAIFTGARQGELVGLKWQDVDLTENRLHIRRSYGEGQYAEPKSANSHRTIALSPFLVGILKNHKAARYTRPDAPVFANGAGKPLDARNIVQREFEPALQRAGLRRIRFHDLRHTYAALMVSLGENPKFIQHQMGHSSITVTMDRYGHLLPQASAGVGERLDSAVFGENVRMLAAQQGGPESVSSSAS